MNKYSENELMRAGINVASLWGAECISYEIKENEVVFLCIEHGERFTTSITKDEIAKYL